VAPIRQVLVPIFDSALAQANLSATLGYAACLRAHAVVAYAGPTWLEQSGSAQTLLDNPTPDMLGVCAAAHRHKIAQLRDIHAVAAGECGDPRGSSFLPELPANLALIDLIVVPFGGDDCHSLIKTALSTGCPIAMLPRHPYAPSCNTLAIAWDGSVAATNALRLATAIAKEDSHVVLLQIDGAVEPSSSPLEAAYYLGCHGIAVTVNRQDRGTAFQPQEILAVAAAEKADWLFVGHEERHWWGRSRTAAAIATFLADASFPVVLIP
jgi:nucleotide-binding universal stress UspA family protein